MQVYCKYIWLCVTCVSMYRTNIHSNKHHVQRVCSDNAIVQFSLFWWHAMMHMMHSIECHCTAWWLCVTCVSMYRTNIHSNKHHVQRVCRDLLHSSFFYTKLHTKILSYLLIWMITMYEHHPIIKLAYKTYI